MASLATRNLVCLGGFLALGILAVTGTLRSAQAGLVVHYDLDEGAGTLAADGAGAAPEDGTLVNMDNSNWVAGQGGTHALSFTAADSEHVTTASLATLPNLSAVGSGSFTLSTWINTSANANLIGTGDTGSGSPVNRGYEFRPTGLFVKNASVDGSTTSVGFSTSNLTGEWIHVLAVRDAVANELRTYRNGQLDSTTAYAGTTDLSNSGGGA